MVWSSGSSNPVRNLLATIRILYLSSLNCFGMSLLGKPLRLSSVCSMPSTVFLPEKATIASKGRFSRDRILRMARK